MYALGIFGCRATFKKIRTTHYVCLLMMAPSHPRDGRAFTDYGEWLYSLREIANFLETSRILSERSQRQLKVHVLPSEPYRGTFYSPICRPHSLRGSSGNSPIESHQWTRKWRRGRVTQPDDVRGRHTYVGDVINAMPTGYVIPNVPFLMNSAKMREKRQPAR